jgi:hypothetical protein
VSLLKFCAVAVSSTSSLAPSQSLASAIDRVPECPNLISTVLRSQRDWSPTDGECADVVTHVLVGRRVILHDDRRRADDISCCLLYR